MREKVFAIAANLLSCAPPISNCATAASLGAQRGTISEAQLSPEGQPIARSCGSSGKKGGENGARPTRPRDGSTAAVLHFSESVSLDQRAANLLAQSIVFSVPNQKVRAPKTIRKFTVDRMPPRRGRGWPSLRPAGSDTI
jgi:hypothetical protein